MNTGNSIQTSDSVEAEYDFPPPNLARKRRRTFVLCMVVATGFVAVLNIYTSLDGRLLAGDLQKYQWRSVALAATIGVAALCVPLLRSSRRGLVVASVLFIAMAAQLTYLITVVALLPKDFPKFTTLEQRRETAAKNAKERIEASKSGGPKSSDQSTSTEESTSSSKLRLGPESALSQRLIEEAEELVEASKSGSPESSDQPTSAEEGTSRGKLRLNLGSALSLRLTEKAKELLESYKSGSPEFSDSPAPAEERASPAKSGHPEFH